MKFQDLKNGRFYNECCFDAMKEIPNDTVDMVLCDLPFGTTALEWDNPALRHERRQSIDAQAAIDIKQIWSEYNRVVKPGGAIALFSSQRFTALLITSNYENFAYTLAWDKKFAANFAQAKRMPLLVCEDIAVFSTTGKLPRYFPIMIERDKPIKAGSNKQQGKAIQLQETERSREYGENKVIYTTKSPTNLLPFSCREERGLHPTQKPVSLCEYLIRTHTNEGELILDNTAGSGTTAIAAINTNRRWVCIEKEEKYANKAIERIRSHKPLVIDNPWDQIQA